MLKRLLVAAALLLPSVGQAQADYQFTNFTTTSNGFTATLLFRNFNQFGDPTIVGIGSDFTLGVSSRVNTFCSPVEIHCNVARVGAMGTVGNVQTSEIHTGTGFYYDDGPIWTEDSCASNDCTFRGYDGVGAGVLGCQVAAQVNMYFYSGRTCAAAGYDGWISMNLLFGYSGPQSVVAPAFDASDLTATFSSQLFTGPNVLVTPEPSTYVLLGAGLLTLGIASRRRRRI